MKKQVIKKIIALVGIIGFFVGLTFVGDDAFAQNTCVVSEVKLDPAGNQSAWYTRTNRSVALDATLSNCQGSTVYLRVWGRTSLGNVIVADRTISVGTGPTNAIVKLQNATINIGEEGCRDDGSSPQCQYYLTFSDGPSVEIFSSQATPLYSTSKDVIGFNRGTGNSPPTTTINPITTQAFQSSYTLALNAQGDGRAIGGGTFPIDTEVNVQALPDPGNYLLEWTEGGVRVSTNPRIKVKLTNSDRTLTAVFASGISPYLPSSDSSGGNIQTQSDCTIGPVNFDPQGNLLFSYDGGTLPVEIKWLATNCYGKKLKVTIGLKTTLPGAIAVSSQELDFNDALFGFDLTSNPYNQSLDIMELSTTANLGDGGCDLGLFPACQFFIEIEDVSPVNSLGILHSSRGAGLRTTSMNAIGFHCFGACDMPSSVGRWSANPLAKEYSLKITIKTDGNVDSSGGRVQGEGTYPINSDVNIDAFPNTGYQFLNWELENGATLTSKRAIATMLGNRELIANFAANTSKTLSVNVTPAGGGTVAGAGTYPVGSLIEVVATPNTGWRLAAWRQFNATTSLMEIVGRGNGIIIQLNDDVQMEAEFEEFREIGIVPDDSQTKPLVPCQNDCNYNYFVELISNIINFIFLMVIPLAGLMSVITGIMILTSGGNPSRLQQAKGAFGKFFTGLIIVVIAWLLVATVLRFLGADGAYSLLNIPDL